MVPPKPKEETVPSAAPASGPRCTPSTPPRSADATCPLATRSCALEGARRSSSAPHSRSSPAVPAAASACPALALIPPTDAACSERKASAAASTASPSGVPVPCASHAPLAAARLERARVASSSARCAPPLGAARARRHCRTPRAAADGGGAARLGTRIAVGACVEGEAPAASRGHPGDSVGGTRRRQQHQVHCRHERRRHLLAGCRLGRAREHRAVRRHEAGGARRVVRDGTSVQAQHKGEAARRNGRRAARRGESGPAASARLAVGVERKRGDGFELPRGEADVHADGRRGQRCAPRARDHERLVAALE
eukprot:scaffold199152_cov27-Tisochrysis_lutea.AAC.1